MCREVVFYALEEVRSREMVWINVEDVSYGVHRGSWGALSRSEKAVAQQIRKASRWARRKPHCLLLGHFAS